MNFVLQRKKNKNKKTKHFNKMRKLLIIFIVFVALISSVMAIKCFSCESAYELNCGEYFNDESHFKLDCNHVEPPRYLDINLEEYPNATACFKQSYKERGVPKIVRHCYFGNINETDIGCSIDPSLMFVENLTCHICHDTDFCNQAIRQSFVSFSLFQHIILIIYTTFFY